MTLKYWNNFSKKENSTEQPLDANAVTVNDVRLKDNTSYLNPTFILTDTHAPITMTYISWQGRFYFITDRVKRNNNVVEISCECDVLATYKTAIGNYTAFIERSASNYDTLLNDKYISSRQINVNMSKAETVVTGMETTGSYVIRVIGKHSGSVTGIGTFVVNAGQLANLLTYAFDGILGVITNAAVKAIFNPFEYIVSVMWFPWDDTYIASGSNVEIYLGQYATGVHAKAVKSSGHVFGQTISRPPAYYNDFRDYSAEFTKSRLLIPTVGLVDVDPIHLNKYIVAEMTVDWVTGDSTVLLTASDDNSSFYLIGEYKGKAAAPIQIGQTAIGGMNLLADVAGAAANIAVGNYVAGAAETVDAIRTITQPTQSILGSTGSMAFLKHNRSYAFYAFRHGTKDFMTTTYGRPLCENKQISTLSGFVKCANASISIDGFKSERDKVNSYLNSGFYYE